jgi:hypothetical protein
MRLWLRLLITLIVLAGIGMGAWAYVNRRQLACQWALYRVGAAPTLEAAKAEIAWFESGPDYERKLRELAGKWGTGNERFDLYLAEYVAGPQSPEALRRAFSLGFAWHEQRLPRWAHYWSWQTKQEPHREIASILAYLDLLAAAEPAKTITWREVLDLQAVFCLAGEPGLAKRLDPENWRGRYRGWRKKSRDKLPRVARPGKPFPDWQGPGPPR